MKLTYTFIVLLILSYPLKGQILSGGNDFFFRGAPGLSLFIGNLDNVNYDKPYVSYAFKGGAGYFFNYDFAAVLDYRIADYPRTDRPSVAGYTRNHTMNVFVQYNFFRWREYELYVLGGLGMTFFGTYDEPAKFKPVFGPMLGGGVNIPVTNRISLYLEGTMDVVLDDEAMDGKSGRKGIDVLGFFGAGIRVNLRQASGDITGMSVSGPRRVDAGESFVLEALFEGNPAGYVTVRWDLGDGNIVTGKTIAHVYRTEGVYAVTVMASNRWSQKERRIEIEVQ